jgi:rRNA maturation endonuclease Nob1
MEPLNLIAGMGMALGLVLAIGYPFFISHPQPRNRAASAHNQQLLERKDHLYAAIKELEFDQDLGKISAGDYQSLRRQLEAEALSIIQQLDQMSGNAAHKAHIESQILIRRKAKSQAAAERCPQCQAARHPDDRFCPQCGARFQEP